MTSVNDTNFSFYIEVDDRWLYIFVYRVYNAYCIVKQKTRIVKYNLFRHLFVFR